LAKIVCFKCKIEGHHVISCSFKKKPLSEKKEGKRPVTAQKNPLLDLFVILFLCIIMHCHLCMFCQTKLILLKTILFCVYGL
jgi:hypothetical protein